MPIVAAEYENLFPSDLKYFDVIQGMTGDCWLLSTVSALINSGWHPNQIVSANPSNTNSYTVEFMINGIRVFVPTDDEVAMYINTTNLVNARS